MATKKLLPLATMEILLRHHGAVRVSEKAKEELKNALEEISMRIATNSVRLALHAGRKTVKGVDVELAAKSDLFG